MSPETQHVITTVRNGINVPHGSTVSNRLTYMRKPRSIPYAFDMAPFKDHLEGNPEFYPRVAVETVALLQGLAAPYHMPVARTFGVPEPKKEWFDAQRNRADKNLQPFGRACIDAIAKGYLTPEQVNEEEVAIGFATEVLAIASLLRMPRKVTLHSELALHFSPAEIVSYRLAAPKLTPNYVLDVIYNYRRRRTEIKPILWQLQARIGFSDAERRINGGL